MVLLSRPKGHPGSRGAILPPSLCPLWPSVLFQLSATACSQSTQADMRGAGNQQSGTLSLRISTLEEPLEQQEVGLEADRSLDYTHCMLRKWKKKDKFCTFQTQFLALWWSNVFVSVFSLFNQMCVFFTVVWSKIVFKRGKTWLLKTWFLPCRISQSAD